MRRQRNALASWAARSKLVVMGALVERMMLPRDGREPDIILDQDLYSYPDGLDEFKKRLGKELDQVRLAGAWSADHHFQVGTLIAIAKTFAAADAARQLMNDYAAC
jgi:hypothetical protein